MHEIVWHEGQCDGDIIATKKKNEEGCEKKAKAIYA